MRWRRGVLALVGVCACGGSAPWFESVLELDDTTDPVGPYLVEAYVQAPHGVASLVLRIAESPGGDTSGQLSLQRVEGDDTAGLWRGELRGRPAGSAYEYYFEMVDRRGVTALFPDGAPAERLGFRVLNP